MSDIDGANNKKYHIEGQVFNVPQLPSGLYIVPTPIGHLKDITLRALEVLSAADLILCEDTRHSRKLLDRYGIKSRLKVYHDHSDDGIRDWVCRQIAEGKALAVISDAGMPIVSDPGFKLVEAVHDAQLPLFCLPGASAGLTALIGSGLPPHPHLFFGFLAPKQQKRERQLASLENLGATLIFYEAPHRLVECLNSLKTVLGDREASVGRELTKQFEENRIGALSTLMEHYHQNPPKGEIVICVGPPEIKSWTEDEIDEALTLAMASLPLKKAAQNVAEKSGLSKRDLYQRALALKNETG